MIRMKRYVANLIFILLAVLIGVAIIFLPKDNESDSIDFSSGLSINYFGLNKVGDSYTLDLSVNDNNIDIDSVVLSKKYDSQEMFFRIKLEYQVSYDGVNFEDKTLSQMQEYITDFPTVSTSFYRYKDGWYYYGIDKTYDNLTRLTSTRINVFATNGNSITTNGQLGNHDIVSMRVVFNIEAIIATQASVELSWPDVQTVEFSINGGTGDIPQNVDVILGDSITITDEIPTGNEEELFYFWSTNAKDTGGTSYPKGQIYYPGQEFVVTEEYTKFYACYKTPTSDEFTYTDNGDGTVSAYDAVTTSEQNLVLPSIYNGKTVTSVYNPNTSINRFTNINSIILPSTITKIGDYAFNTSTLTSINFPFGLKTIGEYAFTNCSNIKEAIIPDGLTSVSGYAFYYCTSLKTAIMGEGPIIIRRGTFARCSSLKNVTLPSNLETLENAPFNYCYSLTSLTLPDTIVSIGQQIVANTPNFKEIILPEVDHTVNIEQVAFMGNSIEGKFYLPNNYVLLTETNGQFIQTQITEFETDPTNTKYMTIDGVIYSRKSTNPLSPDFNVPMKLDAYPPNDPRTSFTIFSTVSIVRRYELQEAYHLEEFVVEAGNPTYTAKNGILYDITSLGILSMPMKHSAGTTVVIDEGVKFIGGVYNENNQTSQSLTSPTALGYGFINNYVTGLVLPQSTTALIGCSLQNGTSLSTVNSSIEGTFDFTGLPNLFEIGYKALEFCIQMKVLKLNSTIKALGDGFLQNAINLEEIYFYSEVPPILRYGSYCPTYEDHFKNLTSLTTIYVPAGAVEVYKTAPGWSLLADRIVALP